jgi:peroxiredoxin
VNVGDVIPTIELPQQSGGAATLDSLAGARGPVVLFWTNDLWMSAMALRDLARIAAPDGVAFVGIAVGVHADAAQKRLADAGAKFPQLVDAEGTAFAQVGELALPRIYVLDAQRRIAWFDIEYSEATYRELLQTLATLNGGAVP